jgi:hypothetical protein
MIKKVWFVTRDPAASPRAFETALWRRATRVGQAPADARPARATLATVLPALSGPAGRAGERARHDAVGFLWFTDEAYLARHEAWAATAGDDGLGADVAVVVHEAVPRGADWLERHLRDGAGAFKHLALARRADGLTREEFSHRWAAHAGQTRPGGGASVVIPASARGDAYVQNHPLPPVDGADCAYDAVNEVYFARLADLRERVRWFQENPLAPGGDDLFGPTEFLAVREEVILSGAFVGAR